ncbi:MAG: TerB family tellurite resistance protein, partial [bacterium]
MRFAAVADQNAAMLDDLDSRQRLQLIKFVCSFAWADLEVRAEERTFVARLVERLDLDERERRQV